MSWTTDGTFEVGSRSTPEPEQPNLCFDGDKPIAEIEFQGNRIPLVFDTGAVATHLWPKFNTDFGALLGEPSDRGLRQIRGVAGTADVESLTFSSVPFRVAGFQATLQPAHVLLSKTTQQSERYYGNLGIDLLNQADRVTLDFRAMRLTLE